MAKIKHYKNETGSDLLLDCGINIGTVAEQYIKYKKPDGKTTGTWAATLYSSYSILASAIGTYFLKRTLGYTDLDQSGDWVFQAWVAAAAGTWWGEAAKERIYDEFE